MQFVGIGKNLASVGNFAVTFGLIIRQSFSYEYKIHSVAEGKLELLVWPAVCVENLHKTIKHAK